MNKLIAASLLSGLAFVGANQWADTANAGGMGPKIRIVECGNGTTAWAAEGQSRMSACLGKQGERRLQPQRRQFKCGYDFALRKRVCRWQ